MNKYDDVLKKIDTIKKNIHFFSKKKTISLEDSNCSDEALEFLILEVDDVLSAINKDVLECISVVKKIPKKIVSTTTHEFYVYHKNEKRLSDDECVSLRSYIFTYLKKLPLNYIPKGYTKKIEKREFNVIELDIPGHEYKNIRDNFDEDVKELGLKLYDFLCLGHLKSTRLLNNLEILRDKLYATIIA